MKIGIIDADLLDGGTRHPNLALMKISAYYKDHGHSVTLLDSYLGLDAYDKVYISKVFTFSNIPDGITSLPNVLIGGTGFYEDGGENLPDEIEHHMPDYDLYDDYTNGEISKGRKRNAVSDYLDYSIGFTTRGCFRKCGFCVNKKYDKAVIHSPVKEFYDPARPYIYRAELHRVTDDLYAMANRKLRTSEDKGVWETYIAELDMWNDEVSGLADGFRVANIPLPNEPTI